MQNQSATQDEMINRIQEVLLDKEEEDVAELVPELNEVQVSDLYSMMVALKSQNEMRARIVNKLKYDIRGFIERGNGFVAYCQTEPFKVVVE